MSAPWPRPFWNMGMNWWARSAISGPISRFTPEIRKSHATLLLAAAIETLPPAGVDADQDRQARATRLTDQEGESKMTTDKKLPLEGILVLELGHTVMGPTAGLVLADMGADVYKVERTGKGDDTRWLKGFGAGFFTYFNRNKKSISIDLKSDKGKEILLKLIEKADVLIENFGPETVERLGVGYETCRERNPRLIYCSLKGFMPGPYEKRPALDEVVQMMGGLAYMTGPTGRPLRAGASITDILGGSYGVIGILAALYQRQFTGQGQLVQATLVRIRGLPRGPAHGHRGHHRPGPAAHAGPGPGVVDLRSLQDRRRRAGLHRGHLRPALAADVRDLRVCRLGGRPASGHQPGPDRPARLVPARAAESAGAS